MIIDCIADMHGNYPNLDGGDLLIIAGDLTARDTPLEYKNIFDWMYGFVNYTKVIFIGGNHDNLLQAEQGLYKLSNPNLMKEALGNHPKKVEYLCDSGTEFEGVKIWGSPWTTTFPGINPHCCAFTVDTDEKLNEKWSLIPQDTDILITHSPSFGNYDWIKENGTIGPSVGSISLWMKCLEIRPKLHVFGHIHEAYGHSQHQNGIKLVNASYVNERYKPVNRPIRIIL